MKSKHILGGMDLFADTVARVAMRVGSIQKQGEQQQCLIMETKSCCKVH